MVKYLMFVILIIVSCDGRNNVTKEYYENGNIKEEYVLNELGEVNGEHKSYFLNGNIKHVQSFKNGVADGKFLFNYESGILRELQHYKDGELNGLVKKQNNNGKTTDSIYYFNGIDTLGFYFNENEVEDKIQVNLNDQVVKSYHYEKGSLKSEQWFNTGSEELIFEIDNTLEELKYFRDVDINIEGNGIKVEVLGPKLYFDSVFVETIETSKERLDPLFFYKYDRENSQIKLFEMGDLLRNKDISVSSKMMFTNEFNCYMNSDNFYFINFKYFFTDDSNRMFNSEELYGPYMR